MATKSLEEPLVKETSQRVSRNPKSSLQPLSILDSTTRGNSHVNTVHVIHYNFHLCESKQNQKQKIKACILKWDSQKRRAHDAYNSSSRSYLVPS